jgi:hypothetical protein
MPITFQDFPDGTVAKYRTAYDNAKYYLAKARTEAKNVWGNQAKVGPAFDAQRSRFTTFWGPLTEERCTLVATNLQLILTAMLTNLTVIYDDKKKSKAYVFVKHCAKSPGEEFAGRIHFCPPLLENYAALGTNSALGTIVHEMSHLVLGTDDHIYGMLSCSGLTPPNRVTNADNYKYYTELFQYRPGTEPELTDDVTLHTPPERGG